MTNSWYRTERIYYTGTATSTISLLDTYIDKTGEPYTINLSAQKGESMNITDLKGMSFETYEDFREYVLGETKPKERKLKTVALAYPAFFGHFANFFTDLKVIKKVEEVKNYDLIVFAGGQDIEPRIYNRTNTGLSFPVKNGRDEMEVAVYNEAVAQKKKMYGSCRGHQLLGALNNGSLWQDYAQESGGRFKYHPANHELEFNGMGIVQRYFRGMKVTSMHHQAISETGLMVTSTYNGLPESIESRNIIGTQFHPEFMAKELVQPFFDFLQWEW